MFNHYLTELINLMGNLECTDENGTKIGIDESVAKVVELIETIKRYGNKILWIGNGGSAAIATHSALDYFRTGNIKTQAFYDGPMLTCLANDFGYPAVFQKPVEAYADSNDALVAISSSGKSVNILNAVEVAKQKACFIITLSGFESNNPLRILGKINFYVPSKYYGYVELIHGILCHGFLDLYIAHNRQNFDDKRR